MNEHLRDWFKNHNVDTKITAEDFKDKKDLGVSFEREKTEIIIAGEKFSFKNSDVRIESNGCDLYVTEKGFDENTKKLVNQYTSERISLPGDIRARINDKAVGIEPCSKIYEDAEGKKQLDAYFD